jgi:hypothetical protein
MRIAYLTNCDFEKQTGVTKKIFAQSTKWRNMGNTGNTVKIFSCSHANITADGLSQYRVDASILRWNRMRAPALISDITGFKPDIVYLRYEPYKGYFRELKAWPVILEVNSDEVSEYLAIAWEALFRAKNRTFFEFARHVRSAVRKLYAAIYSKVTRKMIEGICSGFVFPTEELARKWMLDKAAPQVVIPNSIDLGIGRPGTDIPREGLRLVFMGTPGAALWHGIDTLLKLASKLPPDISVDIIGQEGANRRGVKYHGYLSASEYGEILGNATVGIGTLALYRNKMDEACPLKTREYLASGLPIIIGYKDSAFGAELPQWVLQVPNTDSWPDDPMWVERVVDFVRRMVGRRVRSEECAKYIDAGLLERRRLDFMSRVVSGDSDGR